MISLDYTVADLFGKVRTTDSDTYQTDESLKKVKVIVFKEEVYP